MNELIHHGLLALRDCLPNDSELTTKVGMNVPSAPPNLSFLSPSSLFSPALSLYIFTSLLSSFLPYHLSPFFSFFTFLPPFSPLSPPPLPLPPLALPPSLSPFTFTALTQNVSIGVVGENQKLEILDDDNVQPHVS